MSPEDLMDVAVALAEAHRFSLKYKSNSLSRCFFQT